MKMRPIEDTDTIPLDGVALEKAASEATRLGRQVLWPWDWWGEISGRKSTYILCRYDTMERSVKRFPYVDDEEAFARVSELNRQYWENA